MNSFRQLIVWQKSIELVTQLYTLTGKFPKEEMYALSIQIRRAAISIPSNIAEGFGRRTTPDFIRFLTISRGSLYELQTQIEISSELKFISKDDCRLMIEECTEIDKMLNTLIKTLKQKIP